ncbi:MAG: hypothetical protein RIF39_12155 [Cyclobacteriaceae bacterium]
MNRERVFYKNAYFYFILAALVTVLAFMPSYFQRLDKTDAGHHLHGIAAMIWIIMMIAQPLLYRKKLMIWHKRIGKLSFVLVPVFIISGLNMVYAMLIAKDNYPPQLPYQLAFIDFFSLIMFLAFYVLAIFYRKNVQLHARYMVCTVLGILIPAITRFLFYFPFIDSFNKSLNVSYLIVEVILLMLLFDDKRSGKTRPPYVLAMVLFGIQHLLMNFAKGWEWWRLWMNVFSGI